MPTVLIDDYEGGPLPYRQGYAVVAVDVIRATTTAITAAALGRRCLPAPSAEAALAIAQGLNAPLLAGELAGVMPPGFHINNSPAEVAARKDVHRPLVLLSSSGTRLLCASAGADAVHLACFRNAASVAGHLAGHHSRVALIGADSRGEFREEDQMCCAWIAADFMAYGYTAANPATQAIVARWRYARPAACLGGRSAAYLRGSGQVKDLEFVLTHINDLQDAFALENGEVVRIEKAVLAGRLAVGNR